VSVPVTVTALSFTHETGVQPIDFLMVARYEDTSAEGVCAEEVYASRRGPEPDRSDSTGISEEHFPVTEVSPVTDSLGTGDADLALLDSIEAELDEVERTLAGLDDDGP
jgi:hypothetical protein